MSVSTSTAAGTTKVDRQRMREDRGLAPAQGTERLPRSPRQQRPLLAVLAVLLIVGGAAVAGLVALRQDERVPVLSLARDVPVGSQISAEDLTTTQAATNSTLVIKASQSGTVVGQYARVSLVKGQLVDSTMISSNGLMSDGQVAVGASLAAGRYPAGGLMPGDHVMLVHVADGEGTEFVGQATMGTVSDPTSSTTGSALVVTLIVNRGQAAEVAGASADGSLSVVLISRGDGVGGN